MLFTFFFGFFSKVLEPLFMDLHGNNLSKECEIIKTLIIKLEEKIKSQNLNIPYEVLHSLVRTQTFIRLNNMNKSILENVIIVLSYTNLFKIKLVTNFSL